MVSGTLPACFRKYLLSLFNQCPLAGGDAVYWARAAYALAFPAATYNDSLLCAQAQPLLGKPRNNDPYPAFNLFPNPAQDFVVVQPQNLPETTEVSVVLYDMMARERLSLYSMGNKALILDTLMLEAGTYWISVAANEQNREIKKLIIVR